ncbi:6-carboxytetrahydropterin synthase QueD [Neisseriaceae bacterium ESL0693]|nr:6-carboxytetrahydropterin synthase QueD [Neisseriaceae bacterium ESL0693]
MHCITKEFQFDSCHMLDSHQGKCHHLHGHTYRLQVEICAPLIQQGASTGMVMDFADLKTIVNEEIIRKFDHAFLYNKNNVNENRIAQLLQDMQRKVCAFSHPTTAEYLSQFIADCLSSHLPVSKITLWETPTSFCTYETHK